MTFSANAHYDARLRRMRCSVECSFSRTPLPCHASENVFHLGAVSASYGPDKVRDAKLYSTSVVPALMQWRKMVLKANIPSSLPHFSFKRCTQAITTRCLHWFELAPPYLDVVHHVVKELGRRAQQRALVALLLRGVVA